jgi:hypothetical protein
LQSHFHFAKNGFCFIKKEVIPNTVIYLVFGYSFVQELNNENLPINLKIWQTWSGTNRYLLKIFRANLQTTERFELIGE